MIFICEGVFIYIIYPLQYKPIQDYTCTYLIDKLQRQPIMTLVKVLVGVVPDNRVAICKESMKEY